MSLVLLVEDDVLLRAGMTRALHKLAGVDVVEAGTAEEAIQLIEGLPIDLLVSDFQLGDRTALEVLPHARREGRTIPTLLVSGCLGDVHAQLPSDLQLVEKPVAMGALRDLVSNMLGRNDRGVPFSLADYVQLAAFGRHTVEISVAHPDGEPAGTVTVRDGQAWSATDALGDGMNAFLRLVTMPSAGLACAPATTAPGPRNLQGPCEGLLMEAARLVDERRGNRPAARRPTPPPPELPAVPRTITIPPKALKPPIPKPVPALAQGTVRNASPKPAPLPAKDPREFDRLYEAGIDALLHKRYSEARALLIEARAIRTTPTLEANLERLRALGVA